jgi:hypothetical protein
MSDNDKSKQTKGLVSAVSTIHYPPQKRRSQTRVYIDPYRRSLQRWWVIRHGEASTQQKSQVAHLIAHRLLSCGMGTIGHRERVFEDKGGERAGSPSYCRFDDMIAQYVSLRGDVDYWWNSLAAPWLRRPWSCLRGKEKVAIRLT